MQKTELEQFKNKEQDLIFWIKEYLATKIYTLKVNKGVEDFKREENYNLLLASTTIEDLKASANQITIKMSGLSSYSSPLINFYNYVIKDKKVHTLTKIDTNYINTYTKLEKINKDYFIQLRSLFKFIDMHNSSYTFNIGLLKDGTKAKLPLKMTKEKTYNYLEPEDLAIFVSKIKEHKGTHPNPFVVKLMLKFFCFGGFRADEVRQIKEQDISFKEIEGNKYIQIYVLGKGEKEGFTYILYDLIKNDYEKYLEVKREKEHNTEYLFYTRAITIFSSKRIYNIVKEFFEKTGIKAVNFSNHTLRRSYATYLHFSGVKAETVSILLRHSQEETRDFYIFATNTKTKEVPSLFRFI